jgi:hypothetical protein
MRDAMSYWSPIIDLRNRLGGWVRVAWRDGTSTEEGEWGNLLLMPTATYLEGPDGPWPLGIVEWVDLATRVPSLGAARPPRFVDIKDEILAGLHAAQRPCEIRETTWSAKGSLALKRRVSKMSPSNSSGL